MWFRILLAVWLVLLSLVRENGVQAFGPPMGGASIMRRQQIQQNVGMEEHTRPSASGARSMTMMPIGIPKVAYKMPGSRGGEWVDIYQRLTRERIIFMGSEIDDEMANQIIGVLLVRRVERMTPSFAYRSRPY